MVEGARDVVGTRCRFRVACDRRAGPLRERHSDPGHGRGDCRELDIAGARTQDQLVAEYALAEVFALTPLVTDDGDRDGIPNVLREAMAELVPLS